MNNLPFQPVAQLLRRELAVFPRRNATIPRGALHHSNQSTAAQRRIVEVRIQSSLNVCENLAAGRCPARLVETEMLRRQQSRRLEHSLLRRKNIDHRMGADARRLRRRPNSRCGRALRCKILNDHSRHVGTLAVLHSNLVNTIEAARG